MSQISLPIYLVVSVQKDNKNIFQIESTWHDKATAQSVVDDMEDNFYDFEVRTLQPLDRPKVEAQTTELGGMFDESMTNMEVLFGNLNTGN